MSSYYDDTLYPLQDKVLKLAALTKSQFYLTGGTALSRGYLHHRYSDDLDLFVNRKKKEEFTTEAEEIFGAIEGLKVVTKSEFYYSGMVDEILKIDLINDTGPHYDGLEEKELFLRVDNMDNILANKITAIIGRDEAKDVIDIVTISQERAINWREIFTAVNSKAAGIFPPMVAEKLSNFPVELAVKIKWIEGKEIAADRLTGEIERVVAEILEIG